ncbi:GNAT family N-acetyltransferase [Falsiroseomonas selenitidurans]|uniref:N-acetyltransferase n=1 Tax=Falsiroseomonas selenitidurans TaxID=2716335 RepID=A0ABX1E256_9PROT|nr:GNAT family N-acetyltransferase [Falsiroseomonas selenitidurans]NKC31249.1 N-acetyltransferase [Falsiroseomonas selenitidurans]
MDTQAFSLPARPAPAIRIRPSRNEDLGAITAIYGHHVRHGTASFELEPPGVEEMRRRRVEILMRRLPYLVAEDADGAILGYAYAGAYRPRAAYGNTVENSIYARHDAVGRGIGTRLLAELIARCEALGLRQMVAVVGDSANLASVRLHQALGFRVVGTLHAVGRKHGRWLDSVLLQRPLGRGEATAPLGEG